MPIYEYRCTDCHQIFEEWCKHTDGPAERSCPICRGKAAPLISHTSFALKGTGWYSTDYGTHKNAALKDSAAAPPAAGGASSDEKAAAPSKDKTAV